MYSAEPDQVRGVRFIPSTTENTLSVEWSRPRSDAPILYYEIRSHQRGHSWQGPIRAPTEMVTIRTSLVPSASYGVQVRAVSAIGAGPYSREVILGGICNHLHMCTCISYAHKHTITHAQTMNDSTSFTLGHAMCVYLGLFSIFVEMLRTYKCTLIKIYFPFVALKPPLLNITSGSSWLYVEWNAQSATFRVLYRESGAPDYQVIVPRPSQLSHNISALQPNTLYNIVVEATHTLTQQKDNSSVTRAYTTPHGELRM